MTRAKTLAPVATVLALIVAVAFWRVQDVEARPDTPEIQHVNLSNLPVTGGADVLSSSITLSDRYPHQALQFSVGVVGADSTFELAIYEDGTLVGNDSLQFDSAALTAGRAYTFTYGAGKTTTGGGAKTLTYNVRFGTSTTIHHLKVNGVPTASN